MYVCIPKGVALGKKKREIPSKEEYQFKGYKIRQQQWFLSFPFYFFFSRPFPLSSLFGIE